MAHSFRRSSPLQPLQLQDLLDGINFFQPFTVNHMPPPPPPLFTPSLRVRETDARGAEVWVYSRHLETRSCGSAVGDLGVVIVVRKKRFNFLRKLY